MLAGGASKSYAGVLRSRKLAREVEEAVHLESLFSKPDTQEAREEAIDTIQKSLRVDEGTLDGLLYLHVSLPGLPRMASDPGGARRAAAREATAKVANAYADALDTYLRYSDTDRDSVLLRAAGAQLQRAQKNYLASVNRLGAFIRRSKGVASSSGEGGSSSKQSAESAAAAAELQSLYQKRGELEARMQSAMASQDAMETMVKRQDLVNIPDEDPLLFGPRHDVYDAQARLEDLQIQYGDQHPRVVSARKRLALAEKRLQSQVQAMLKGHTSNEIKTKALQVEYSTVARQIESAEQNFQVGREQGAELERRKNDVNLNLEVLKTTMSQFATMSLNVPGNDTRMKIVDEAIPPPGIYGHPGIANVSLYSFIAAFTCILLWFAVEFVLRTAAAPHIPALAATNVKQRG